jgi:hypothetical protein
MAKQSKMSLPTTFLVFSLQLFDFSTDQKNKIHFGFGSFHPNYSKKKQNDTHGHGFYK